MNGLDLYERRERETERERERERERENNLPCTVISNHLAVT